VEAKRLTLHSDGSDWRNFIPLTDVGRLVAHLLALPAARVGDGLFNAGSLGSTRILDIADLVAARCEHQFGFRPLISVGAPSTAAGRLAPLDYRTDRLQAVGFVPSGDVEGEIDRTLRACAGWFSTPRADAS
jgi:UDP-glucose 4-epimerase